MHQREYLTVSMLTKYIKRKFDADPHLASIFVKGEISNFKQYTSGHMYFTLKDEQTVINAVMFRKQNEGLAFTPENGMKVLIEGNVSVYETDGRYQLYAQKMQIDGVGDLFIAFEQLKKKLEAEGLFHDQHKKKIPLYPEKIGVITSPTGAAIRDIVTTIKRRYPIAEIIIFPAVVQGKQSAGSLVVALMQANQFPDLDVIILGRGGGSLEDLWSFNEEAVARSIYHSKVPIISAVGHETDYTIADYVADMRAPTPTAASEFATPELMKVAKDIYSIQSKIFKYAQLTIQKEKQKLMHILKSYAFNYPRLLLQSHLSHQDQMANRLQDCLKYYLENKRKQQKWIENELLHLSPAGIIDQYKKTLQLQVNRVNRAVLQILQHRQQLFLSQYLVLNAVDPLKIIERGYAAVFKENQQMIRSFSDVQPQEKLIIQVVDGSIDCTVNSTRKSEKDETK